MCISCQLLCNKLPPKQYGLKRQRFIIASNSGNWAQQAGSSAASDLRWGYLCSCVSSEVSWGWNVQGGWAHVSGPSASVLRAGGRLDLSLLFHSLAHGSLRGSWVLRRQKEGCRSSSGLDLEVSHPYLCHVLAAQTRLKPALPVWLSG